ncbi:MAG: succinate dehydrogenase, cytochrome b556 subunit [Pseudomonadota bacterium]
MADVSSSASQPKKRPLSPHLQIYKPMLTMMMSIMHRVTGVALYFGSLLLAWVLIALATGPEHFAYARDLAETWFGQLVLFGYTWALFHHMLGGIRHLVWDTGRGFHLNTVEWFARLTLIGGLGLAVLTWVIGYNMVGAL